MITKKSIFKIKTVFLTVFIITISFFTYNCSSVKSLVVKESIVPKKRIEFEFKPNGFQLATTGNGFVDVYADKLEVQILKGDIRINPRYTRFKTSSAYAIQIVISRYFPGDKCFNILATGKKIKIKKILKSRDDFYAFSNFKYTFLNIANNKILLLCPKKR